MAYIDYVDLPDGEGGPDTASDLLSPDWTCIIAGTCLPIQRVL